MDSRFAFAHLFARHGFEFFIEGHLMAFAAMNGTPMALRYDNLKSVVIKRQHLTYNAAFLEFANYYGFEIRLCNPASGNEKGRVERLIRSIRDTFENTAATHQSLSALNGALHDWIHDKNSTVHRSTDAIPNAKKLEEKLKPLPVHPYPNVVVHAGKSPSKTGLVTFDTNAYATVHVLFKLLNTSGRSIIESLVREAVRGKSPRLKFIMSALNLGTPKLADPVSPQNQELLALDYKPRSLEDYDEKR